MINWLVALFSHMPEIDKRGKSNLKEKGEKGWKATSAHFHRQNWALSSKLLVSIVESAKTFTKQSSFATDSPRKTETGRTFDVSLRQIKTHLVVEFAKYRHQHYLTWGGSCRVHRRNQPLKNRSRILRVITILSGWSITWNLVLNMRVM